MENSPFNRLPAELRNRIWSLALDCETYEVDSGDETEPALLRTCRQIREETQLMFYAENTMSLTIYLGDASYLCRWLEHLGPKKRAAIKQLHVDIYDCGRQPGEAALTVLLACWGVQDVTFDFEAWEPDDDDLNEDNSICVRCDKGLNGDYCPEGHKEHGID